MNLLFVVQNMFRHCANTVSLRADGNRYASTVCLWQESKGNPLAELCAEELPRREDERVKLRLFIQRTVAFLGEAARIALESTASAQQPAARAGGASEQQQVSSRVALVTCSRWISRTFSR